MKQIKYNDETVAIFHKQGEWREGLDFLTSDEKFIQAGTWWYEKGKILQAHTHVHDERTASFTQETIIIMEGSLRVDLYGSENEIIYQETLRAGDIAIMLTMGHGYEILEDGTRVVEVKNGPYHGAEMDRRRIHNERN